MHSRAVRVSFKGNVWSIDAECAEGTVSQGKAVVQESGNIACALGYSHNLDGLGRGAIDDEVSAHRPEQNRVSGQVLAPMANAGCVANGVERSEQLGYPLVGGVNIILAI